MLRHNVSLGRVTRFQVGGACDLFFVPSSHQHLASFLHEHQQTPFFVLGAGSNLLVRDGGFRGACIQLGAPFSFIKRLDTTRLQVGAATLNSQVASFCAREGLGSLSFLSGIPGRIGGALRMNAGCYGHETKDVVEYVVYMDQEGGLHTLLSHDIPWTYRNCGLEDNIIFLEAILRVAPSQPDRIQGEIEALKANRASSQPIGAKTGGSTFKNPDGLKAWELIAAAGCTGMEMGDAQVSTQHCNFLINRGHARAYDLEMLGERVRARVWDHNKQWLEWEIKLIGERK